MRSWDDLRMTVESCAWMQWPIYRCFHCCLTLDLPRRKLHHKWYFVHIHLSHVQLISTNFIRFLAKVLFQYNNKLSDFIMISGNLLVYWWFHGVLKTTLFNIFFQCNYEGVSNKFNLSLRNIEITPLMNVSWSYVLQSFFR